MKTLKSVLFASFALASSAAAFAETSAQSWLETYYQNPRPAELPRMVLALSQQGYFDQAGHSAVAIGFLGTVFQQNPQRVGQWVADLQELPLAHQRLVAAALWQAGDPRGSAMLRKLAPFSPVRAQIEQLAGTHSIPVSDTKVLSASSMNLQWGAFLASGDERHIVAILAAIGTGQPGLDEAARYSLAQAAAAHPRVMEICRDQLAKEPSTSTAQSVIRSVLEDAASARGTRS